MSFKTTLAGTNSSIQLVGMAIVEAFYHSFCKQVPFHREVYTYSDGGKVAIDWAFTMPMKSIVKTPSQDNSVQQGDRS